METNEIEDDQNTDSAHLSPKGAEDEQISEEMDVIDYKDYDSDMVDLSLSRITSIGTFYLKSVKPFLNLQGIV